MTNSNQKREFPKKHRLEKWINKARFHSKKERWETLRRIQKNLPKVSKNHKGIYIERRLGVLDGRRLDRLLHGALARVYPSVTLRPLLWTHFLKAVNGVVKRVSFVPLFFFSKKNPSFAIFQAGAGDRLTAAPFERHTSPLRLGRNFRIFFEKARAPNCSRRNRKVPFPAWLGKIHILL